MARTIALSYDAVSIARTVTAKDTVFTDTALPATTRAADNVSPGGMVAGRGFQTVWLGLQCPDGTAPTAVVSPRVRDANAPDGSRWKDLTISGSAQSVTLTNNGPFIEVRIDSRDFMPVVTDLTGTPTSATILVFPGTPMPWNRPPSF